MPDRNKAKQTEYQQTHLTELLRKDAHAAVGRLFEIRGTLLMSAGAGRLSATACDECQAALATLYKHLRPIVADAEDKLI